MTPRLDLTPDFELIHLQLASRVSVLYTTRRRVNKKANRNAPNFATTQKLCRGETICSHFTRYKSMFFFDKLQVKVVPKVVSNFRHHIPKQYCLKKKQKFMCYFLFLLNFNLGQIDKKSAKYSKILVWHYFSSYMCQLDLRMM